MNFRFTDEQRLIASEVRSLLDRSWSERDLRQSWRSPEPAARLRRALADIGLAGLTVPERYGGTGGDERDLVLVLEELGRAAAPDSVAIEAGVGMPLLVAIGGELAETWLPRIASGRARVAVGAGGDGGYVLDAPGADLILVMEEGGRLLAFDSADAELVPVTSVDGARRLFRVTAPAAPIAMTREGLDVVARDRLRFVEAATLLGLAGRMLEMAVAHALARRQFGQPIGAFQAVKHRLADATAGIELARPTVYAAAWSLSTAQPDASRAVAMAKLFSARAAATTATHALQVHGGIGFAAEHDLHLYLKRAKALELASGGPEAAVEQLAVELAI